MSDEKISDDCDPTTGVPNICEECGSLGSIYLTITDNEDDTVGVAYECWECGALYDQSYVLSILEALDEGS